MLEKYFPRFRFSPLISGIALSLALSMFMCANWQWSRYLYKRSLVASYEQHSVTIPLTFPAAGSKPLDFEGVLHKKVGLEGSYDFSNQFVIGNQRHASGPGFWLITPFQPDGAESRILVSRGFIPFADSRPEQWSKYNFEEHERLTGVVQETVAHRSLLSPKSSMQSKGTGAQTHWLYPDLAEMAKNLPYPVNTSVYVQRLGPPPIGLFPAESVSIRVPPSTHFGYTIEWTLLGLSSLVIAFLMQAYPRRPKSQARTNNWEQRFDLVFREQNARRLH